MQRRKQDEVRRAFRMSAWPAAGIVFTLGAVTGCGGANDTGSADSLAQRLQAVEDRIEIQQLLTSDYSTAIDTRDWKTFGSLFTEDGEFNLYATQFPPREHKGRSAIESALAAPPPPGEGPVNLPASMKHVITNPHIQVTGDKGTATTYWQEVAIEKDGKVSVGSTGYYRDVLKRDQGHWRFKSREVFNYDMAQMAVPGAQPPASPPAQAESK